MCTSILNLVHRVVVKVHIREHLFLFSVCKENVYFLHFPQNVESDIFLMLLHDQSVRLDNFMPNKKH